MEKFWETLKNCRENVGEKNLKIYYEKVEIKEVLKALVCNNLTVDHTAKT